MSKIILVYGFSLSEGKQYKVHKGCEVFCCSGLGYIGIKFGQIKSMFDNLYQDKICLQINKTTPGIEIIKNVKKLYPNEDTKCMALIQNTNIPHNVSGNIYCGYWISYLSDRGKKYLDDSLCYEIKLDSKEYHEKCIYV